MIYFREVARHLHFRKAAEALNLAQPALSRQIAQLEGALNTQLFIRTKRRVELTPAGRAFSEQIEPILRSLQTTATHMGALSKGEAGHLRIAFTGVAMATVLPKILRTFRERHPLIQLELNESPSAAQLQALRDDEIACGFFNPDANPPPQIHTRLLLREKNGILLPSDHPLVSKKPLRLQDIADIPLILFPRSHNPGYYDSILAAFNEVNITPRIAEEVWPRTNAIGLVRSGFGATFMCPSEAKQFSGETTLCPLKGPAPESRLVIGWKHSGSPTPALNSFLAIANP